MPQIVGNFKSRSNKQTGFSVLVEGSALVIAAAIFIESVVFPTPPLCPIIETTAI